MSNKKPKKVKIFSEEELKRDLESYRKMAIELGATDAKVIPADEVYIDSRVRIKCTIPKCPEYGSSAHCPPHAPDPDQMRELVGAYKKALLVIHRCYGENSRLYGRIITDLGLLYYEWKRFREALDCFKKAHDILLNSTNTFELELAYSYNNLGDALCSINDTSNGIIYYNRALDFFTKDGV